MKKIVLFCCMAIAGLLLVACSSSQSSPEKVAVAFVEAMYKNDTDELIKLSYLPKEHGAGAEDMLKGKLKQAAVNAQEEAERKGGVKSVTVSEKDVDDANGKGRVRVKVEFRNDGSTPREHSVQTIRSDDKWKVTF